MVDRLSIKRDLHHPSLYTSLVTNAFDRALALDGRVSDGVLAMRGMSGRNYRVFINNLIGSLPDARYLEVGSWAGSTACSAIQGNRLRALCIDNWSQFGGPRDEFFENVATVASPHVEFSFLEQDFRSVAYPDIGRFNAYLFDGPHEQIDQYDGLALALPALDEEFIFVVDDWNWPFVRQGTTEAIRQLGLKVAVAIQIRTTQDGSHAEVSGGGSDWHNGYFLSVLRKP